MRQYWRGALSCAMLASLLGLVKLDFALVGVGILTAAWFGAKVPAAQLEYVRQHKPRWVLAILLVGAALVGFGGFFHLGALVAAGLASFLLPVFAAIATDIREDEAQLQELYPL